jgi:hypothetical protein
LTRPQVRTANHGKYQLDVTACDVADVVRHAGGWLYDRATAGWDVAVTVTGDCDLTPLRILGVRTERPEPEDDDGTAPPRALALAASADALVAAAGLRDDVLRTLKRGVAEVTVWGECGVDGLDRSVEAVEHVLSAAARAFKTHALRAAGVDEPAGPVETFRRRPTSLAG